MNLSFFKTTKGILTLGLLIIIVIAIPITVYLVGQQQNLKQSAQQVPAMPSTPSGYYPPLGGPTSDATGNIVYLRAGLNAPRAPTPFYAGAWHFPTYHIPDSTVQAGFVDGASTDTANTARLFVIGPGKMTIHIRAINGTTHRFDGASLIHYVENKGAYIIDESQGPVPSDTDFVFNIPSDGFCIHWVEVAFMSDINAAGLTGFGGFDWVASGPPTCGAEASPTVTSAPTPTNTPTPALQPTATSTPVPSAIPTSTLTPTNTPTLSPTATLIPTATLTVVPTNTSTPTVTDTPVPGVPTNTPTQTPTPTSTPGSSTVATNTPVPGTATSTPTSAIAQNPTLEPTGPSTTLINIGILGIIIAIVGAMLLIGF